jgi:DNA-binding MarR family transcriptional regulator
MTTKRDPQSLLPLTPAMFYVLVALADGQTHGYAILKDVEALTDGSVRLSTGTLYGIIKRLLSDGLIRESGSAEDQRRRSYELTAFGREVARAEAARPGAGHRGARPSSPSLVILNARLNSTSGVAALTVNLEP